jgi:hypothetical protein
VFDWIDSLPPFAVYLIILVLAAIVYQIAFAVKLPLWKNILLYMTLAFGCLLLLLFHYMGFPMIQILAISAVVILIVRLRLTWGKKNQNEQ